MSLKLPGYDFLRESKHIESDANGEDYENAFGKVAGVTSDMEGWRMLGDVEGVV